MDRKEFLTTSAILAGATILPSNSVFAENINNNGIDKLTDEDRNFIHQPLPYNTDYLEPFMDAETLHLHHTFHHGGAVKGANKDIEMIKSVMNSGDLHWLITGQRNSHFTFPVTFCTAFFGQTWQTKNLNLLVIYLKELKRILVLRTKCRK